uniref:Uncharacterized protein n=1 Tax=Pseudo-nitzschia australis TaxID=44445 RepID=A0A7S4ABG9_9STRA|mmetsp:Transcript_789/g.1804  ORF Transcript_789/g.1804 Transcript_789/m.1804 type:complete len:317 (+) Transcript_789:74-1024(+)|eukprot:CAMPEP_0168170294 /NCGR_PEP_ID=MMETSP0139_2-20121125/4100_1 /TAXON_ID=44445 /ORGANISM="Pseudo-nitzschia australis, Strain 10249 10 AB" /LENGTH=316 /DNA_ID=CAMNT_0008087781 /DNA_START=13 /DNA_END=963 /DNA_ORIENTATION=+
MGSIASTLAFPSPDKEWSRADLLRRQRVNQLIFLTTRSGYRIPAVHIQRNKEARFTIIYSHGNAEDVGLSLSYLDSLSHGCDCNVLAYEYCGYSIADGEASEKNCYECIDAAYRYLVEGRREAFEGNGGSGLQKKQSQSSEQPSISVKPHRIVLFGRSLGTGPTVDLAARLLSKRGDSNCIAGVVLQSPLESAGRCVLGEIVSFVLYPLDLFRSYEKIEKLAAVPVFIMHGVDDKVVPCASGKALYASLTKERKRRQAVKEEAKISNDTDRKPSVEYPPKWIPRVGHNDMPDYHCICDVTEFLQFLEQRRRRLSLR